MVIPDRPGFRRRPDGSFDTSSRVFRFNYKRADLYFAIFTTPLIGRYTVHFGDNRSHTYRPVMNLTFCIRCTNCEVVPMFKKFFNSVVDICRPGRDESACQWGEAPQTRAEASAQVKDPGSPVQSEQPQPDPTSSYNSDQSVVS